ncbi:MAG: response regulator [Bdellovibrionales bacterium]|nr:response regulator [Bdellovibrionales bacterium]
MTSDKRIFIVEDDLHIRESLTEVLEIEGFNVFSAVNGQDALDKLRSGERADLILLDLMMPIKDGFQFKAEQEVDPKISHIPVIVMSANGNLSNNKDLGKVKDYLKKPIDLDALLETINRFLGPN